MPHPAMYCSDMQGVVDVDDPPERPLAVFQVRPVCLEHPNGQAPQKKEKKETTKEEEGGTENERTQSARARASDSPRANFSPRVRRPVYDAVCVVILA